MITARNNLQICGCGVARTKSDKVVIDGERVFCNAFCAARHRAEPHDFHAQNRRPTGVFAQLEGELHA